MRDQPPGTFADVINNLVSRIIYFFNATYLVALGLFRWFSFVAVSTPFYVDLFLRWEALSYRFGPAWRTLLDNKKYFSGLIV